MFIQIVAGCIVGNMAGEFLVNHVVTPIKEKVRNSKKES